MAIEPGGFDPDTVGCKFVEEFATPRCRISPSSHSRQYELAHGILRNRRRRRVVEYDGDRKTVEILGNARPVSRHMEVRTPLGITWMEHYRVVAALGLTLVAAHEVSPPLVSELPGVVIPGAFLMILVISTGYQLWSYRWIYLRRLVG